MGARVTIIIPAYNPGKYLSLAVGSVLAQTYADWELLIIDDGSPQPVGPLVPADPRIRVVRQNNAGQAAARNRGITLSAGEFVAFLDQDDLFFPSKLEKQIGLLDANPDATACHTQFDFTDTAGTVTGCGYGRAQTYAQMLEGTGVCGASTVVVRRAALEQVGGFRPDDQPAEDLDLWLRLAREGPFLFLSETLASYRLHGENQSLRYRRLYGAIERIQVRHLVLSPRYRHQIRAGLANYRNDAAGKAFEQLRCAVRSRAFVQALRHGAFVLRHRPGLLAAACLNRARRGNHVKTC